jgi:hypothetical protein
MLQAISIVYNIEIRRHVRPTAQRKLNQEGEPEWPPPHEAQATPPDLSG